MAATFGTGGNCEDFYGAGFESAKDIFRWLSEKGLDSYEYEAGNGLRTPLETLKKIREESKKYNIKTSVHAPFYIALSSADEKIRNKSVLYIAQSVEFAENLGAYLIVVHSGGLSKNSREKAIGLSKDTIKKALDQMYKQNSTNVKIGIETMGMQNQLGTVAEVLEICKMDKLLVPVVDFAHIYAREGGLFLNKKEDYKVVFDLIAERLGFDALNNLHCHFAKIEYTDKGEKKHRKFSEANFGPYPEQFAEVIAEYKISPNVICESNGTMTRDALKLKKLYGEALLQNENTDN